jgi:hypothetical protein
MDAQVVQSPYAKSNAASVTSFQTLPATTLHTSNHMYVTPPRDLKPTSSGTPAARQRRMTTSTERQKSFTSNSSDVASDSVEKGSFRSSNAETTAATLSSRTLAVDDAPRHSFFHHHDRPVRHWEISIGTPSGCQDQYVWDLKFKTAAAELTSHPKPGSKPVGSRVVRKIACPSKSDPDKHTAAALAEDLSSNFSTSLERITNSQNYRTDLAYVVALICVRELCRGRTSEQGHRELRVYPKL